MLIFDQLRKDDPPLRMITWVVLVGMAILLGGLWYVQVISYRHYTENQKAQSYRTVRIPGIRGKILDRHARPLAENQATYHVSLYLDELRALFKAEWRRTAPPGRLKRSERTALEAQARFRVASNIVHQLAITMREPLSLDAPRFLRHYTNQLALPLLIMTNLTPAQVARFQEMPRNVPGLDLEVQPTRVYPLGTVAAHIVGYLKRDDRSVKDEDAFFNFRLPDFRGEIGIEGAFDQELRGKAGVKSVLVNNLGYRQSEEIWTPADPGRNVTLTIDLDVQLAAEQALQSALSNYRPVRGAIIVLDPNNGDILALVSSPSFDPNAFVPRINYADWQKLSDEELKPQRNRATQENYQPGSIFKIVIALACLDNGLNPLEKIYNPPYPRKPSVGFIQVGRRDILDTAPPGEYDFQRAFIRSCNTYFITNGLRCGIERIVAVGQRLHLGERADLPTRQDNGGRLPSMRRLQAGWFDGHTANFCIGQGEIDVTPLQMAVMIAAIANGGKVYWPRLVDRVEPQDRTSGEAPKLFLPGRLRGELGVSARTLHVIREAMLADVEDKQEGTGRLAAVPGMRIGGKTGTAQITDENNRVVDHTTWFASYGPHENPRYVVLVMVEGGASGSATCAPIAGKIYRAIQALETRRKPPPPVVAQRQ